MQAHRSRQFMVDHTLVSAAVLGIVVSSVTLIITLGFTGDLPGLREPSANVGVTEVSINAPYDRMAIGAGEGWVGGRNMAQEQALSSTQLDRSDLIASLQTFEETAALSRSDYRDLEINASPPMASGVDASVESSWEYMEQNPALFSQPEGRVQGPGEGLNDFQFIEENTIEPSGAWVGQSTPTTEAIKFAEDNEFGTSTGMLPHPWGGDALSPDY